LIKRTYANNFQPESQGRFSVKLRAIGFLIAAIAIAVDMWVINLRHEPVSVGFVIFNCLAVATLTAGALWPRRRS
jgi:hypothetical protein